MASSMPPSKPSAPPAGDAVPRGESDEGWGGVNRVGVEKREKCCLVSETLSPLGFTIALYPVYVYASS